MESPQISGKVFRFLSTMHPSLSKAERKKYSEYDPERWYPWTPDIASEFTDLMRRSPRDTSFARGLAYTAQKSLPEDTKLTPGDLVRGLPTLPAAFTDGRGSGFDVQIEGPGRATVSYRGMPGFTNACIAIAGELTQRMQALGARGLEVKHASGCRLQGADACNFEVRWAPDAGEDVGPAAAAPRAAQAAPQPAAASPAAAGSQAAQRSAQAAAPAREAAPTVTVGSRTESAVREPSRSQTAPSPARSTEGARPGEAARAAEPSRPAAFAARAAEPPRTASPAAPPAASARATAGVEAGTGGSAQDLFEQLRVRLLEAEQQSSRHADLENRIADLEAELAAVREQARSEIDQARAEAEQAADALIALKRQIRALVGDN
ncbi:MAG TPA: hypothetical protein VEC57_13790 [Candidatus Limnocylindrales bacterium]|nr:hypothetical protein [Candidatus Limnocylindrales bacterium]